jgi:hypothetical protein
MLDYRIKFFKDINRASEFCNKVNGELHYKGSATWDAILIGIEYPEGLEEFRYIVLWESRET